MNNEELIFSKCANSLDRQRNHMVVLVFCMENVDNDLVKSKYIICPKCKEPINLKIDNYITLTNCGNNTDCFKNLILDKNLSSSNKNLFNDLIGKIYGDSQNSFYIITIKTQI